MMIGGVWKYSSPEDYLKAREAMMYARTHLFQDLAKDIAEFFRKVAVAFRRSK